MQTVKLFGVELITNGNYIKSVQILYHFVMLSNRKPLHRLKKLRETRNIIIQVERVVERNGIILFPINCDRIIE